MKARVFNALSITAVVLTAAALALFFTLALRAASPWAPTSQKAPASTGLSNTSLWLSAGYSLTNNAVSGSVYGTAPGSPYFLLSRTSLSTTSAWTVEQLLIGRPDLGNILSNGLSVGPGERKTPFFVPLANRPDTLFFSVRPWSSNDDITSGLQIAITNPVNGSVFSFGPTNLILGASASGSNPVLGVAFYDQSGLLGWASNRPYLLPWSAPTGLHILNARAFDSGGHSRPSEPSTNTVGVVPATEKSMGNTKPDSLIPQGHFKSLSCTNAPSGLIGWWRAEGDASDTLHLHDGVLQGWATASTAGTVGQTFHFDGTNGCVVVQDSLALRPTNLTIEAWVRFSSLDSPGLAPVGKQYIVFRQNSRDNNFEGFSLVKARGSNGLDCFKFVTSSSAGSPVEVISDSFVTTNVWYHIAAVRGSNYIQLYTNGQFSAQATVSSPVDYGYWPLFFGSSGQNYWDRKLAGDLDEVAIYDRALSTNEIRGIYDAGASGKCLPAASVQLLCPAESARFCSPSNIFLTASAYSPGTVTNVQFFTNSVKLGESTYISNALCSLTWTNPPLGAFAVTAVAKDDRGLSATSSVANVTITAAASFFAGINLNGTNVVGANNMVIEGNIWTSYAAALTNGLVVSNSVHGDSVTNFLSSDGSVNLMLQSFLRTDRFPPPLQQTNQPTLRLTPTNSDSFFLVGLSNTPAAYAVSNAVTYRGWCLGNSNLPSLVQSFEYTYGPYTVTNSLLQGINFNRLNYLVNHKNATNANEIQNAIWALVGHATSLNSNTIAMTNDAVLHGSSFVPGTNQLALVVLDTGTDQPVCIEISGVDATPKARNFTLTQTNLSNGDYYVGLWLAQIQTNCLSSLDIKVQDIPAAMGIGSDLQFGQWSKYGAYGGNVTNGNLKIEIISPVRGDPMLMGLAIYKAVTNPPTFQITSTNQSVCPGGSATFCATNLVGDVPLTYQWFKGNNSLSSQTNSRVTLSNITNSDAGTYTLIITNAAGSATNSATLTVWTNVSILTPPANTNACPGGTASFCISASGSGLSYQWYFGTNLLGTNSCLSLTNVNATNAGSYCVVVSGTCGAPITNCATLTIWTNVSILTSPANTNACPGSTASFCVSASGSGLSYQWFFGTNLVGTASCLSLTNVNSTNAGSYCVKVSGNCGPTITNCATLTVWTNVSAAPLTNVTANPGASATFVESATGTGLTYHWYFGTNLLGTNSSLTLTNINSTNAGTYCVVVSGPCSAVTNCAILTIVACVPAVTNLVSWWQGEGNACDAVGGLNGTLVGGVSFATGKIGQTFSFSGDSGYVDLGTATSLHLQDLTIEAWIQRADPDVATANDGGGGFILGYSYGGYTLALYDDGTLTFSKVGVDEVTAPSVITDTAFHHVAVTKFGNTVVFYVDSVAYPTDPYDTTFEFSSNPSIGAGVDFNMYFWGSIDELAVYNRALDSSEITAIYNAGTVGRCGLAPAFQINPTNQSVCPGGSVTFCATNVSGTSPLGFQWSKGGVPLANQTNSCLSLNNVTNSNAGSYTLVITNAAGSSSVSATLIVYTNATATPLTNLALCPGSTASFSTTPSGTGGFTYRWTKDGVTLTNQTASSLTLSNISSTNAGSYCVVVTGTCNSITNCATLTVWTNVSILTSPANTNVCPASTASFSIGAIGSGLNYHWYFGTNLLGTNSSLTLTNVNSTNAGTYCAVVNGTCGPAFTNCATLTVWTNVSAAPLTNLSVISGASATFVESATGTGLTYHWYFGTNLLGTSSSVTLTNVSATNAGSYCVVVSATCRSVTNCATLTVADCVPATSNLVAWWQGEGNASDAVSGINGTIVGDVGYTSGTVGQGFNLDGMSSYVDVGNPASLQLQDLTIEAWIKRADASVATATGEAGGGFIFGYSYGGYTLALYDDGRLTLSKVGIDEVTTDPVITDTDFHHVAVTKSGSTVTFYVDSVAFPASDYDTEFTFDSHAAIGAGADFNMEFWGIIDEVSIYNRALAAEEILAIYNASFAGKCSEPAPSLSIQITSPINGQLFVFSPTNILISATGYTSIGTITNVTFYANGTNIGSVPNSQPSTLNAQLLWTNVLAGPHTLTAFATNSLGAVASNGIAITVNAMPVVSILKPLTNFTGYPEVTNVLLQATNYDSDGTVTNVKFYCAGTNISGLVSSNNNIWSLTWSNRYAGNYAFTAAASDNRGASSSSEIRVFKVTLPPPQSVVTIIAPTNGAFFPADADIDITAIATNFPGSVTNVEIFIGTNLFGSGPVSPFTLTEFQCQPGKYEFAARATDSDGRTAVSEFITITVTNRRPVTRYGFWDPVFGYPGAGDIDPIPGWPDGRIMDGMSLMVARDKTLYVNSGEMLVVNDVPVQLAAKWDGTNWFALGEDTYTGTNHLIGVDTGFVVKEIGGKLLFGNAVAGQPYTGIANWDGTNWTAFGGEISNYYATVYAIAKAGPDLYIGGSFIPIGTNENQRQIARLVGNNWVPVGADLNGTVHALAVVGSTLYVGGSFTNVGTLSDVSYIARLDGTNWTALGTGVNDRVRSLAVRGSELFVGGDFTVAGGLTNANHIAKWNGSAWSVFGNGVTGVAPSDPRDFPDSEFSGLTTVSSIAFRGNDVFVGGRFDQADPGGANIPVRNVAKATWSESDHRWNWSELDNGLYVRNNPADDSAHVNSLAIREGDTPDSYDLFATGWFWYAGSGNLKSGYIARWSVGRQNPTNAPRVTVTSPAMHALLSDPPALTNTASVVAGAYAVSSVEYFLDGASIGNVSDSPYELVSDPPAPGTHRVLAVATDSNGGKAQSVPVVFNVNSTNSTIRANPDFYTINMNDSAVTLRVLTNDTPAGTVRISEVYRLAGPWGSTQSGNIQIGPDRTYLTYTPFPNGYGTNIFTYSITNGSGDASITSVEIRILAKPIIDVFEPTADGVALPTNGPLVQNITGLARDYDGVITNVTILLDGAVYYVTNGPSFHTAWTNSTPGYYVFTIKATDNDGLTSKLWILENTYTIGSTNTVTASIDNLVPDTQSSAVNPEPLATIRDGVFALQGKARDSNTNDAVSYQLTLYQPDEPDIPYANVTPGPLDDAGFHHGGDVTNSLGTLDFSHIPAGTYDLKLIVHGGGGEATDSKRFRLESNLKIGQFGFSEQDLVLPVSGIPITVTRTYNSLNPRTADFGYSWTMALNSMDVQLDETRRDIEIGGDTANTDDGDDSGTGPRRIISVRSGGGRDVTLTLPDGRRTTFTFTPRFSSQEMKAYAEWIPPSDVHATLGSLDPFPYIAVPWVGPPVWQQGGEGSTLANHDISGWALTNQDGTVYLIRRGTLDFATVDISEDGSGAFVNANVYDAQPKLTEIRQRTGDRIVIGDNSIQHYNSTNGLTRSMFFNRDSAGRVIEIQDPISGSNGLPVVKYVYNRDTGNLIQVLRLQDRTLGAYLTTSYHYDNANFPHYITSIEDPRGIPLARNEYDDDGRLTAVTDADGNRTEFRHDTTNRVEVVIDRLGHTNSHAYDLRGNVTASTNAANEYTLMSYDDKNNVTSTTDSLGHTTSYAYDDKGNQIAVTNALNHVTLSRYDIYGNLTGQTDPLGNVTTNLYDEFGNLTNTVEKGTNGITIGQSFSVFDGGKVIATKDANRNTTASFTYDDSGNLSTSTDARGFAHSFGYDSNGNQTSSTSTVNGTNVTTSSEYDAQGRAFRTIDALGNTNQTFYNPLGKVDYTIDRLGHTNSFFYDTRGNTVQTTGPDGLSARTVYDSDGRAIYISDRNGITGTRTDYDLAGRVTNSVRLTNISITISAVSDGIWSSSLASAGTPYSSNRTEYFANGWVKSRTGPDGQKTSYTYYDDGQTATVTDALTNVTTYAYDEAGRQKFVADALNHTNQFVFDGVGRNVKTIFTDNSSITNIFNLLGQQVAKVDQAQVMISNVFDVSGQLTSVVMPSVPDPENGNAAATPTWSYGFDQYGRQISMTDAKGRSTTNIFDSYGRQTSTRLPLGQTSSITYDSFGRVLNRFDFKGQKQLTRYDYLGRVATNFWFAYGASYPSNSTEYHYNTLGQLTNITERSGTDASSTYVAAVSPGTGKRVPRYVAALNRIRATPPEVLGDASAFALCTFTLGLIALSGLMKRWTIAECFNHGLHGWARILPSPWGEGSGNWLSLFAPSGVGSFALSAFCRGNSHRNITVNSRPLAVNSLFSLLAPVRCLISAFSFQNFSFCRPQIRVNPRNPWLNFFLRPVTALLILCLIGNECPFDRLWIARAECVYPPNLSTETIRTTDFHYDFDGHLTQINCPEGVINYEYDLATGRHTRACTTNSEVAYGYDELGRLKTVTAIKRNGTNITPELTTYTYTPVGNRSTVTLPNGIVTTYLYDSLNRLTNLTHQAGTTNLATYRYTLHSTGRRTGATEILRIPDDEGGSYHTNSLTWQYDQMYRLTNEISISSAAANAGTYTNSYAYDKVGNRWSKIHYGATGALTTTNQFNANDQLLKEVAWNASSMTESNAYVYDDNGSLVAKAHTADGNTTTVTYGYDLKNKLTSFTDATSTTTTFVYNNEGIRVRSTTGGGTTHYLIDANNHTGYQQILEELSSPGTTAVRSYIIGDDVLSQTIGTTSSWLLYDGHGSTRQLAAADASVSERYNYDAYGISQTGTSSTSPATTLLYCGEQFDSNVEMYNLRARYYSPANGRFNQRDTFEGSNSDPQSLHKYAYCHADPINGVDPSGQFTLVELLSVIAVLFIVTAILLPGLAKQRTKAEHTVVILNGMDDLQYEIKHLNIDINADFHSMSEEDRQTMLQFMQRNGGYRRQKELAIAGNEILTANAVEAVNRASGYASMLVGGVSRVAAEETPALFENAFSGFSNGNMGNAAHAKFESALHDLYGTVKGDWFMRTAPGMTGVDAEFVGDMSRFPGFRYGELKPYSQGSLGKFGEQLGRWGLPEGQTQLFFYNRGGVIGTSNWRF